MISPLSESQEIALRRNGFVISDATRFESFLSGFGWVMSRDLPVYISVDAILDTLHLSFDRILSTIEEEVLYDELDAMLRKMDEGVEDLRKYAGGRTSRESSTMSPSGFAPLARCLPARRSRAAGARSRPPSKFSIWSPPRTTCPWNSSAGPSARTSASSVHGVTTRRARGSRGTSAA